MPTPQLSYDSTPPDGEAFYYSRPVGLDEAIYDHLRPAEVMQLSMDYEADPEAFEEIIRFRGKYIDELEMVDSQVKSFVDAQDIHDKREVSYKIIESRLNPGDEVVKVAIAAAAGFVIRSRQELIDQRVELLTSGEALSTTMASYLADPERLPGRRGVRINGIVYEFGEGLILSRRAERTGWRVTVFGTTAAMTAYSQKHYKPPEKQTIFPRLAEPQDWQKLLDNLEVVSKF